ncbi:MAG: transcription termination/antitermination protein NusG [Tissierellia bacterium]|nr:transcription termination/antitermination protein NusG [Tissierellia bacterium]
MPDNIINEEDKNFEIEENEDIEPSRDDKPRWYVVHTYTGHENKVKAKIQSMIENEQNPNIVDVAVPIEEYIDNKNDKNKIKQRKLFPGYVMVKMYITNRSWYIIRNTAGVTGFVGPDSKPIPLSPEEVKKFGIKEPKMVYDIDIEVGDNVKVKNGPFEDFQAEVLSVDAEKQSLKALVDMFGRETPVDLSFEDVEKI